MAQIVVLVLLIALFVIVAWLPIRGAVLEGIDRLLGR